MKCVEYGKVYFVGAGPGDPSLLTIKAAQLLQKADVVIVDRLVSEEIIKLFVKEDAVIIHVGKQGRSDASTPQKEINDLIVQFAASYQHVVRLKGGDISLYSNILDELITVKQYNISYEIVPGITAVSGASAYAGVPLTARGYSTGVRVLTYYNNNSIDASEWKQLATFNDTLVFYMSANALPNVVDQLLLHHADGNMPFVVVEQATTANQHVHYFTLNDYMQHALHEKFLSPSLIIMGKVAALYKDFAWLPNEARDYYFKPLQDHPELIQLLSDFQNQQHVSRA
jgi:uroporphyrin-III C-methyltransferase